MENMTVKYVMGGIGDMLQCIEGAIDEKHINVFTHARDHIFQPFGVFVDRLELVNSISDFSTLFVPGEAVARKLYPQFLMPNSPLERPKKFQQVIGLHIEGSKFSNEIWANAGQPTKNMSSGFLKSLLDSVNGMYPKALLYVFCVPGRAAEIEAFLAANSRNKYNVIAFENIWDSLSCVRHCDIVLAMDSCIKTMANILRIPSVVLVGDYRDPFRDDHFINPYVEDGHMKVVKFKDIDKVNPDEVVSLLNL